ncbi:hypothetical protein [Streptomyces sp. NPDC048383]|uniref:hypothetical protein n=1 Tax=unclassified Streptomyces TaxID=2593676 RepID=UPI0034370DFF
MIEFLVLGVVAAGAGWLVRRKHRTRQAAGKPVGIPCMARHPAGAGRWRAGRVHAGRGEVLRWEPRRGEAVPLSGARSTGVRVPTVREGIAINPGSRIVACALQGGGEIEIAVMPLDVRELLEAVPE